MGSNIAPLEQATLLRGLTRGVSLAWAMALAHVLA